MAWRIHFTSEDLERIQVSPTLGPLAETVMALSLLGRSPRHQAMFSQWRGQVSGRITAEMKPLTALRPPGSPGVDLCTLTGEAATIEQGIQALLAMPREHLLLEMEMTDRRCKLPAAAWAAVETDGEARQVTPGMRSRVRGSPHHGPFGIKNDDDRRPSPRVGDDGARAGALRPLITRRGWGAAPARLIDWTGFQSAERGKRTSCLI
jgi:hypothetical protein